MIKSVTAFLYPFYIQEGAGTTFLILFSSFS